jgi:hypothetical protein
MNDSSPAIWSQDDSEPEAHAVADARWSWPSVINTMNLPSAGQNVLGIDATSDECSVDYSQLGRDGDMKVP